MVTLGACMPLHIIVIRFFIHQVFFLVDINIDINLFVPIMLDAILFKVSLFVRAKLVLGLGLLSCWLASICPILLLN